MPHTSAQALGMEFTYAYEAVVNEITAGALDDIRFFQFGGMGTQNGASSPVFATTSLTCKSVSS